jgi:hypothetical protein
MPLLLVSTGRGKTSRESGLAGWRGRPTLVQVVRWRLIGASATYPRTCATRCNTTTKTRVKRPLGACRVSPLSLQNAHDIYSASQGASCLLLKSTSVKYSSFTFSSLLFSPLTGPGMPVEANMQGRGCAPLPIHQSGSPSDEAAHAQAHCLRFPAAVSPRRRVPVFPFCLMWPADSQQDPGSR